MIKFFRNIRKKLLAEGKTTNYLKYAIGEIILVVIGILIALQLNNLKETNTERKLEKAYIVSLIEDIKKDTNNFNVSIDLNEQRFKSLDSLAYLCYNYQDKNDSNLYHLYRASLRHPDFVSQTDRTLSQLRNAGGMRLITKKTTADSIIKYEDYFKKLTNQQSWCEGQLKDLVDAGIPIFNYKYFPKTKQEMEVFMKTAKIASQNEKLIIELGNRASIYRDIITFYLMLLKEGKQKSMTLIEVLENDYKIKNQ